MKNLRLNMKLMVLTLHVQYIILENLLAAVKYSKKEMKFISSFLENVNILPAILFSSIHF